MSTLADRIEHDGAVPWLEAAAILRGAARALDRPHLGLEPSRILLGDRGDVSLLPSVQPASATYASPERARGERNLDVRADLYALGVMLYEMLLGLPPYVGSEADVLRGHAEGRVKWEIEDVPPGLLEIGRYLTEPDREARLPSPEALLQSLEVFQDPPAEPARKSRSRFLPLAGGCLGIIISLLFIIAGGILAGRKKDVERPKPVVHIEVPPLKLSPLPKPKPIPPPPRPALPVPKPAPIPAPIPAPDPLPPASAAEIEAFLPKADGLAAVRAYGRIQAEAPRGAWTSETMEPYRLAARLVAGARQQLDLMKGRTVSFVLRNPKGQALGPLEAVEGDLLRIGRQEIPWERLGAQALTSLYSRTGEARDEEIFHFAVFEGDVALAREAGKDGTPSGRTVKLLEAMEKAGADEAAQAKRERDGDTALREAQRAHKNYKPEFYRDVLDFHPGTKAAVTAKEALAKLRRSVAVWGFNNNTTEGWTGALTPGGRWSRKGFHLKGLQFEHEGGFAWSPTARFRFDVKSRAATLTIRLDGEGRQASLGVPHDPSPLWSGVDVPLSSFTTEGAWTAGAAVRKIWIEGGAADFEIDNVEIYEAGTE